MANNEIEDIKEINIDAIEDFIKNSIEKFSDEKAVKELLSRKYKRDENDIDISGLDNWYTKLEAAGLPTPKTHIVYASENETKDIYNSFGELNGKDGVHSLAEKINKAIIDNGMSYPIFLRTDIFSGKHDWENCCYVTDSKSLAKQILNIVYFWECANWCPSICDTWVVREMLPTNPVGVCCGYGNMPICREFRFFVDGPDIRCWHPYWPLKDLNKGDAKYHGEFDYNDFCSIKDHEREELFSLASRTGEVLGGKWSVDILETRNGWYVTDVGELERSYHDDDNCNFVSRKPVRKHFKEWMKSGSNSLKKLLP